MNIKIFVPIITIILATSYGCKKIDSEHDEAINLEIKDVDFSTLKPVNTLAIMPVECAGGAKMNVRQ